MMDVSRFKELADAWGGDISRWPDDVRPDAERVLRDHPDLRNTLDQALALDAALDTPLQISGSELLQRRILAGFPRPAFDADWRRPAVAAAAALVIGIAGGFGGGLLGATDTDSMVALEYSDAFDGLSEDWSAWEWSDA